MKHRIFQIDAFASGLFTGNPAAVVPMESWPEDATLQAVASENNLSETAYLVATPPSERGTDGSDYRLRWFTPAAEVSLCGHATLATAHVLWNHLGVEKDRLVFDSRSGPLTVTRHGEFIQLDFPAVLMSPCDPSEDLVRALGARPMECVSGRDVLCRFTSESEIRALTPDFPRLATIQDGRAVIVTAREGAMGARFDFVSRFFAPRVGVNEDPVTGSAHCALTPFWAARLGTRVFRAAQVSARGGELECELAGDRVLLRGRAVTYMTGMIEIP